MNDTHGHYGSSLVITMSHSSSITPVHCSVTSAMLCLRQEDLMKCDPLDLGLPSLEIHDTINLFL